MAVQIQSVKKCGYLRQIAEGAKRITSTLKEAILAAQQSVYSPTFQKGRLVVSQSGSGQSGSFQMAGGGNDWTQDNIFGFLEELLMMIESADPVLYPDDADPAHTDALRAFISQDIMAGNVPTGIRQTGLDVTLIGLPVQGTNIG